MTYVIFLDNIAARIDQYDADGRLKSRKTVKSLAAMIWMHKQEKTWVWARDEAGHEMATAE